jgi:hypothetical protein
VHEYLDIDHALAYRAICEELSATWSPSPIGRVCPVVAMLLGA